MKCLVRARTFLPELAGLVVGVVAMATGANAAVIYLMMLVALAVVIPLGFEPEDRATMRRSVRSRALRERSGADRSKGSR